MYNFILRLALDSLQNLDCQDLIETFEKKYKEKQAAKKSGAGGPEKRKGAGGTSGEGKKKKADDERPRGFDRGLDPERIIGATDSSGKSWFSYMKSTCQSNVHENFFDYQFF